MNAKSMQPVEVERQSSIDTANELFGHDLFNVIDVDKDAFRVSSPATEFSSDDDALTGRELWPPSSLPSSPYPSSPYVPSSPYGSEFGDIPSSPYEVDPQTTSQLLNGHEFDKILKFDGLNPDGIGGSAAAFVPKQPTKDVAIAAEAVPAAVTVHAAAALHSPPTTSPTTAITPGSSDPKLRKSKYRTQPLLPYVRAAIDKVRRGRESVSKVAATTMYNGKRLMSDRTLRRCVEQSQGDPTSVFYYPLLSMERVLKTGRKNKKHVMPNHRAAVAGPADRYSAMTVKALKSELKARGLKQTGRKADHQQRLRESDKQIGF